MEKQYEMKYYKCGNVLIMVKLYTDEEREYDYDYKVLLGDEIVEESVDLVLDYVEDSSISNEELIYKDIDWILTSLRAQSILLDSDLALEDTGADIERSIVVELKG